MTKQDEALIIAVLKSINDYLDEGREKEAGELITKLLNHLNSN